MAKTTLLRILSAINLIALVLCGSAFFIAWRTIDIDISKIQTGQGTRNDKNLNWFSGISVIFCGVLCIGLFIYELLLIINPMKFKFYNYGLIRSIIYFYLAVAVLGVSGDLGISGCAFALLSAIINTVICIALFFECIKIDGADNNGAYHNTETEPSKI